MSFFFEEEKKNYFPILAEWGITLGVLAIRALKRDKYMRGLHTAEWIDACQIAEPMIQEQLPYYIICSNKIWNFFYIFSSTFNLNMTGSIWMWHKDRNVYVAFKHFQELLGQKIYIYDDFWFDDFTFLILFFIPIMLCIGLGKLNYSVRGQHFSFSARLDTQFLFQNYIIHNLKLCIFEVLSFNSGGTDFLLSRYTHGNVGNNNDTITGFTVFGRDLKFNPLYKYQMHLVNNREYPGSLHATFPFYIPIFAKQYAIYSDAGKGVWNPPVWQKWHLFYLGFLPV